MLLFRSLLVVLFISRSVSIFDDIVDDVSDSVTSSYNDVTGFLDDGYGSTTDWVENTWERAEGASATAQTNVANAKDSVNTTIMNGYNNAQGMDIDNAVKEAMRVAFPDCDDLSVVVQYAVNLTIDQLMADIFAFESCVSNISSVECRDFIAEALATIIIEAIWSPITLGLGPGSLTFGLAMDAAKLAMEELLGPYLKTACTPAANLIQQSLVDNDVDLSGGSEGVAEAREVYDGAKTTAKQETIRLVCQGMGRICEVIGLDMGGTDRAVQALISPWVVIFTLLVAVVQR